MQHKIIQWYTESIYTHAELILPNGRVVGISPFKTAVVEERQGESFAAEEWDIISISITDDELADLEFFFSSTAGDRYDWAGMLFTYLTSFGVRRENRWYCSQWIAHALSHAGILRNIYRHKNLSPGKLHSLLETIEEINDGKD